jgi:Ca2+-binding EF-hand superfamily protein
MSISGISGFGGMMFLSQLDSTQATDATNGNGTCGSTSSNSTSASTNSTDASTTAGSAALSSEILALLIQLQSQTGSTAATSSSSSSSGATSGVTGTTGTSGTSSTTANPIASFFSSLDTDGNGSISQSEFESFIENLGGTQSQADTLYSQLTQNSSNSSNSSSSTNGLTEQQLAQDAFGYGPPPPPPSASQMANGLVNAMGGSDGSVTKSEFENFVTSNGGTTSEADQDFAALDTSGSTTLSASDLQQAIQNQQAQASSSTTISPILSWLDSLSATASGTPTA